MDLDDEILINQYAQELVSINLLVDWFTMLEGDKKRERLNDLIHLIIQSKANNDDASIAINKSGLKTSFTPCVLLQKGVTNDNLYRIVKLPDNELNKVFNLFISLFSIAYKRRYEVEKNDPNKWWYWDLSTPGIIEKIKIALKSQA